MHSSIAALTAAETALTGAIAALIGVAAGLITENYRERRRRRLAQPVVRMVLDDAVIGAAIGVLNGRRTGRWWPREAPLPTPGHEVLSTFVTDRRTADQWEPLNRALMVIAILNRRAVIASLEAGEACGRWSEDDRQRSEGWLEILVSAAMTIDPGYVHTFASADPWSTEGSEDSAELAGVVRRLTGV